MPPRTSNPSQAKKKETTQNAAKQPVNQKAAVQEPIPLEPEPVEVQVPSTTIAMWFDPDNYETEVKDIEKESLPEFFNDLYPSKTPAVYREYRNFMIALYRMNPNVYLSATTCRRHLSGDVNGIMRVHAFLEKWGLINFNCNPRFKPHKFSILQESSYNKVLINAANKNTLTKNTFEFRNNMNLKNEEAESQFAISE